MKQKIKLLLNKPRTILNESEKQYLLNFKASGYCGSTAMTMRRRWVPKSLCEINDNILTIPQWYAKKNLNGMLFENGVYYRSNKDY